MGKAIALGIVIWTTVFIGYCYGESKFDRRISYLTDNNYGRRTVQSVVDKIGTSIESDLKQSFDAAGAPYPNSDLTMLVFKEERILELWGKDVRNNNVLIKKYPIKAASGERGPKLRRGDYQVPEGFYSTIWLNPNSSYHLSIKINYPSSFDKKIAAREGRSNLGGDIFIHGDSVSAGCLAMGDAASEELFVLVAKHKSRRIPVVISPWDFRSKFAPVNYAEKRKWVRGMYADLEGYLADFQ